MSAKVPPPVKKKSWRDGAPPTPLQVPEAVCPECSSPMRRHFVRDQKGRIDQNKIRLFCDFCEYAYEAQLHYFNGMNIKYEPPKES